MSGRDNNVMYIFVGYVWDLVTKLYGKISDGKILAYYTIWGYQKDE